MCTNADHARCIQSKVSLSFMMKLCGMFWISRYLCRYVERSIHFRETASSELKNLAPRFHSATRISCSRGVYDGIWSNEDDKPMVYSTNTSDS